MLSFPSNVAKGIAPIAAASIWSFTHGYAAVEWTVFLVSILSAIAFLVAVRVSRHTATGAALTPLPELSRTTPTMRIRAARSEDLDAIKALLAENELPAADLTRELMPDFVVAEDADGSVVGSVGLERFGTNALLRSLAVSQAARGVGLGRSLTVHAENAARVAGISELWLLTTTAADFFRRAGYTMVNRNTAPAELLASTQFSQLY
jgi:amino-acid N-acetyltransferase